MPKLEAFNGTANFDVFAAKFQSYAAYYKWRGEKKVLTLRLLLGTPSFAYLLEITKDNPTACHDADLALELLRKRLMPSENEYLRQFEQRAPQPNESTRDYAHALADLYDKANSDASVKTRTRDLKKQLKAYLPENLRTLIPTADTRSWDQVVDIVAEEIKSLNPVDDNKSKPASDHLLRVNKIGVNATLHAAQVQPTTSATMPPPSMLFLPPPMSFLPPAPPPATFYSMFPPPSSESQAASARINRRQVSFDIDRRPATRSLSCYNWGQSGHIRRNCPMPSKEASRLPTPSRPPARH